MRSPYAEARIRGAGTTVAVRLATYDITAFGSDYGANIPLTGFAEWARKREMELIAENVMRARRYSAFAGLSGPGVGPFTP